MGCVQDTRAFRCLVRLPQVFGRQPKGSSATGPACRDAGDLRCLSGANSEADRRCSLLAGRSRLLMSGASRSELVGAVGASRSELVGRSELIGARRSELVGRS